MMPGQGTDGTDIPMNLSVVITCHNEEVLPELFQRLDAVATAWDCAWEALCVNDGSRDRTWELIVRQHEQDARWRGISLPRNFGNPLRDSSMPPATRYRCWMRTCIMPPEVLAQRQKAIAYQFAQYQY
jgi:Glycosyl transferase family 2